MHVLVLKTDNPNTSYELSKIAAKMAHFWREKNISQINHLLHTCSMYATCFKYIYTMLTNTVDILTSAGKVSANGGPTR